jgi:hypothetical protein
MPDNKNKIIKVMNEYLYEEQLKNDRFEQLIQKEMLTKEEVDFVISWDEDQRDNFLYISEYLFLNLNKNNKPKDIPGFEGTLESLNDLCNLK